MNEIEYPIDTVITKDDFDSVLCEKLMQKLPYEGYLGISEVFSRTAREAHAQGDKEKTKIFYLLAFACAFDVAEHEIANPFKIKNYNAASWGQEVFDSLFSEGLEFFIEIIDLIQNPILKARLADLVWSCHSKKRIQFAQLALENYSNFPLTSETWHAYETYWLRALDTSLRMGTATRQLYEKIVVKIKDYIVSAPITDYTIYPLSKLLFSTKYAAQYHAIIVQRLESYAQQIENEKDFIHASDVYLLIADYYKKGGNIEKNVNATYTAALCLTNHANMHSSSSVKSLFYTNSLNILKIIPNLERARLSVDIKIAELKSLIDSCSVQSLDELTQVTSPAYSLSKLFQRTEALVSQKPLYVALYRFFNISKIEYTLLLEDAKKQIKSASLMSMFCNSVTLSSDGRTVAVTPPLSPNDPFDASTPKVHEQMMMLYDTQTDIITQGYILPGLEILYQEHQIHSSTFAEIISESPIIPHGHEHLFELGCYSGFDGNFSTALHILCPQLEHLVRTVLQNKGISTSTKDTNGISMEKGLSSLIDEPDLINVFGKNTTFELKALFCDQLGPNLRNNIAHGLVSDAMAQSYKAVYAWWFISKIIFNSFHASVIQQKLDS